MKSPLARLPFKTRGYLTLFGGFLIHFVLGTIYLWGNINTYVASYFVMNGDNYTKADVGIVFPFILLAINVGNPFGVLIGQRIGFKLFAMICSAVMGSAIFASSFALTNFTLFTFLYGFVFGVANGFVYMIPFNLCYT